jgi:hypothetical protein
MTLHSETRGARSDHRIKTREFQLRQIAADILHRCHCNIERSVPSFEKAITDNPALLFEVLKFYNPLLLGEALRFYLAEHATGKFPAGNDRNRRAPSRPSTFVGQREPSSSALAATLSVAKNMARTVLDTSKTSDGRPWGDVCAHELGGMERDGKFAAALRDKIGALNDKQRTLPIRELISPDGFSAVLRQMESVA